MTPTPIASASVSMITFTLSVALFVPFVVWFILTRLRKGFSPSVLAGMMEFFLADMVLRFQIVRVLQSTTFWKTLAADSPIVILLLLALFSALFETGGRFVLLRNGQQYFESAVGAGLGHGGLESIANTGITYVSYLLLAQTINNAQVVPEGMEQTAVLLAQTPSVNFLLIGIERLLILPFQIFLMVLLCRMLLAGRGAIGALCVGGLQFAVNFCFPLLQHLGLPLWAVELLLLPVAAASIYLIFRSRKQMPAMPKKMGQRLR